LAERFDVIAPDHPGFGGSEAPPWIDDISDLAYCYLDAIEALGLSALVTAPKRPKEIELEPDAWQRFEHFICDVAKAGPQHMTKTTKTKRKKKEGAKKSLRAKQSP
jgi:pimeloyl-ACP methyl ester carboxylesterase